MYQPEPDKQRQLLTALKRPSDDLETALDPFQYMASANYVVPMLVDLAIERGNTIVDHVPSHSSLDHVANWQVLLAAIRRFDSFTGPYFERAALPDPFAEELLRWEYNRYLTNHAASSLEQNLWCLVSDELGLRIQLGEPVRRSALHLVSHAAEQSNWSDAVASVLRGIREPAAPWDLAQASGLDYLDVIVQSDPASWTKLSAGLGFDVNLLPQFRSWFLRLALSGLRWTAADQLWTLWVEERGRNLAERREEFENLLNLHTITLDEAADWSLQAPFLRCSDFGLLAWPFVFHALPPDLNFLSLLVRRHQDRWNATVGSTLASAAAWVGSRLPITPRIRWTAGKKHGSVEADLIIWDQATDHVLVLEVKTTFDKFRSHIQLRNYVQQRANFPRALEQARTAAEAIRSGAWQLREIFNLTREANPSHVTAGVLTWWDTFNPTLGSRDETLCCNFATLGHVLAAAGGDVGATVTAIKELSKLYCVGVLLPLSMTIDGHRWDLRQEKQTALLPPASERARLSPVAEDLLAECQTATSSAGDDRLQPGIEMFVYDN